MRKPILNEQVKPPYEKETYKKEQLKEQQR